MNGLGLNSKYLEEGLYLTPSALASYENLSPFELKEKFFENINKAGLREFGERNLTFLDGSRGNPNWMCMVPRRAYSLFGSFAMNVSTQIGHLLLSSTIPEKRDIFSKFLDFLELQDNLAGYSRKQKSELLSHSLFRSELEEKDIRNSGNNNESIKEKKACESPNGIPRLDTPKTALEISSFLKDDIGDFKDDALENNFYEEMDKHSKQSDTESESFISVSCLAKPAINNYFYDMQSKKYSKLPTVQNPDKIFLSGRKSSATEQLNFLLDAFEIFPEFRSHADDFIHELVISYLGCLYCTPSRCLKYTQLILEKYLKMVANLPKDIHFKIFPVEGATAGIVYSLNTLIVNGFLHEGDKVALLTPSFPPYIEILRMLKMDIVEIALEDYEIIFDDPELMEKKFSPLKDPNIKLFAMVDPGNPSSCALGKNACSVIISNILKYNKNLPILTDIVYCTFLHEKYHSILNNPEILKNCIIVYSYSKMYGATGMRLGFIACCDGTIMDELISKNGTGDPTGTCPSASDLSIRYQTITQNQKKDLKFIDRFTADSRLVALNHTAGLSSPQQLMMVFYSLYMIADKDRTYKKHVLKILQRRFIDLREGLGIPLGIMFEDTKTKVAHLKDINVSEQEDKQDLDIYKSPRYTRYYITIDLKRFITKFAGQKTFEFVSTYYNPLHFVINLFRDHQIVVLPGKHFGANQWSLRISLANLPDKTYITIGQKIRAVTSGFVEVYFFQQRILAEKMLNKDSVSTSNLAMENEKEEKK